MGRCEEWKSYFYEVYLGVGQGVTCQGHEPEKAVGVEQQEKRWMGCHWKQEIYGQKGGG